MATNGNAGNPPEVMALQSADLAGMADEVSAHEVRRVLTGLDTDAAGNNAAMFKKPAPTPAGDVTILPAPAIGPLGSSKICDGQLTVGGQAIDVTAFRLPA